MPLYLKVRHLNSPIWPDPPDPAPEGPGRPVAPAAGRLAPGDRRVRPMDGACREAVPAPTATRADAPVGYNGRRKWT